MARWLPGLMPNRLVTRGTTRSIRVPGYLDPEKRRYNQLGYRTWYGRFVVLDEEEVPGDVWTTGWDGGNTWRSKFGNWIPRASGGRAEDFAPDEPGGPDDRTRSHPADRNGGGRRPAHG